ncbi:MAG TPA: hypothetical protein VE617_06345 [Propionibacteriaceae bacterium]|nr:hypothetical protein [Propionibacteriaceae bacterium]
MLFDLRTLRGLSEGRVTATYRRWTTVRPRIGSRFTTRVGVVEVTSVDPVDPAALTAEDASAAGFESREALLAWTARKGTGDLYRVGIRLAGPDPRVALRALDDLDEVEVAALTAKMDRMDRAADRPWTRQALELIAAHPGIVSTELAAAAGQERAYFKIRIRRLKALGLTESLEVGYRLSPRGEAFVRTFTSDLE